MHFATVFYSVSWQNPVLKWLVFICGGSLYLYFIFYYEEGKKEGDRIFPPRKTGWIVSCSAQGDKVGQKYFKFINKFTGLNPWHGQAEHLYIYNCIYSCHNYQGWSVKQCVDCDAWNFVERFWRSIRTRKHALAGNDDPEKQGVVLIKGSMTWSVDLSICRWAHIWLVEYKIKTNPQ